MAYGQTSGKIPLIVIDIVSGGGKDIHSLTLDKARLQTQRWGFVNVTLAGARICNPPSVRVLVRMLKLALVQTLVLVPGSRAPLLVPENAVEEGWAMLVGPLLARLLPLGLSGELCRLSDMGLFL
jgi:hypothetical protein